MMPRPILIPIALVSSLQVCVAFTYQGIDLSPRCSTYTHTMSTLAESPLTLGLDTGISVEIFGHRSSGEESDDPYTSDKVAGKRTPIKLHWNTWKKPKNPGFIADNRNCEAREIVFDKLGEVLAGSISMLRSRLTDSEIRQVFCIFTDTSGTEPTGGSIPASVIDKVEREKAYCKAGFQRSMDQCLQKNDEQVFMTIELKELRLECDRLIVAREWERLSESMVVCFQLCATISYSYKTYIGHRYSEEVRIVRGFNVKQEMGLQARFKAGSTSYIGKGTGNSNEPTFAAVTTLGSGGFSSLSVINDPEKKSNREFDPMAHRVATLVTEYMTDEMAERVAQKVANLMFGVTSVASSSTIGEYTPRTSRATSVAGGSTPPFEEDNFP